jgi:hypothetical protein
MEVDARVSRVVRRRPVFGLLALLPERLHSRCGLDERSVRREVLRRQQVLRLGLSENLSEELLANLMPNEALSVRTDRAPSAGFSTAC